MIEALALASADAVARFLEDERVVEAHIELVRQLTKNSRSLVQFFDRLVGLWGSAFEEFALVLILDQFEELFTRFPSREDQSGGA